MEKGPYGKNIKHARTFINITCDHEFIHVLFGETHCSVNV